MTRRVSRETQPETPIYGRLLAWSVWATDRDVITDRRDELAGDYQITEEVLFRLAEIRQRCFPRGVEAIEKAVASLKGEHDELHHLLIEYFIRWKSIERVATDNDLSEFHVTEELHRALRQMATRLPLFEARVQRKQSGHGR